MKKLIIQIFLITLPIIPILTNGLTNREIFGCKDEIYCYGGNRKPLLLEIIQGATLFSDSKIFVDMPQSQSEKLTLEAFDNLMKSTDQKPEVADVIKFLERHFKHEPEMDPWIPPDFKESPPFLDQIKDRSVKAFAKKLVNYWPQLGRISRDHVREHPGRHSLRWVPNGFIIPGGRFREQTYWDSYWIVKGLLICGMTETVKGMLDNFVYLINQEQLSTLPKGARVYYEHRSHPPVFAQMIRLYIEQTNDIEWLEKNIGDIEKNYEYFWWGKRSVNGNYGKKKYFVAFYGYKQTQNVPRAEQWMEDTTTCSFRNEKDRIQCYDAMLAGDESGWDYSTRWMYDDTNSINGTLKIVDYTRTLPVDLNALLCEAARLLSDFNDKLGNENKRDKYANLYKQKIKDMEELFYNETDGMWFDFDTKKKEHRRFFYPTNFAPLWTDCVEMQKKGYYGQKAAEYMYFHGIDTYHGGIPTSLNQESEHNWDFPNAWPPLQDMVVTGLYRTGNLDAKKLAKKFATRYIVASIKGWVSTEGGLYDKYSAVEPGMPGTGGNYPVQIGYGWSIGVALSFISQFACSAWILRAILTPLFYTILFSLITLVRKMLLCY